MRYKTGKQFVYDALNRVVQYKNGSTVLLSYTFDALGRRIAKTVSGTTTDLYLSAAEQVVEERVAGVAVDQKVWSPVYVDAMIERDRDTNSDGVVDETAALARRGNATITRSRASFGVVPSCVNSAP